MNVQVKILNCNLGTLVMFCKLCPEGGTSINLVNGKSMGLEAEVNRRERAGPVLVVPSGWYLKNMSAPSPQHRRGHKASLCSGTLDAELCFSKVFAYRLGAGSSFHIQKTPV